MGDLPDYATTPCRGCGKPVVFVTAVGADGKHVTVPLDPRAPVYVRESDGEGGAVWAKADKRSPIMVSHFATCSHANQFSRSGGAR